MARSVALWVGETDDSKPPPRVKDTPMGKPKRVKSLEGQRFGSLIVESFAGFVKNGRPSPAWLCRCDCGGTRRAAGAELSRGSVLSCGCKSKTGSIDLAGRRFGSWTVVERSTERASGTYWLCRCDCGTARPVARLHLLSGASASCGCMRPKGTFSHRYKHGSNRTQLYRTWCNIIQRCENPTNSAYADYGARGITICDQWRHDFAMFALDMGPRPSSRHTIDRRDNNAGYSPENCHWATRTDQGRNKRTNRLVTVDGVAMPLSAAAEKTGVNYGTAKWRLKHGRTDDEALR